MMKQESIPVGCVLPTCTNCTCFNSHQMSALVVGEDAGMNKFEQVSGDDYQMSIAGAGGPEVRFHIWS